MNDLHSTPAVATRESDGRSDPLWYQDAIIYELHVKAFYDSNGDGIGDFRGLTEKLDYIQELGVNTIWLLPFYPSPMRDDGYDISDYRNIHPAYGTRQDFRAFVREAHRRGLRVITELVINHTSDQHPWFQAARRAPPDTSKRDFYVWSDTPTRYAGTRIIFTDTESSNWSWDPVAGAYYWHRFFSHQPDLNFDHPSVLHAVIRTMRFWLDMGVDGLRLDAIPYLCELDGTSNENLPSTHAVIRKIRAALDAHYGDRMLLAEANQWPEDVLGYFGAGDECHMAFHFPLMPRLFMAIAQEDRHPIADILRQTPDIPANCQWAIFLRNHDELTLEMVTDRERDYMYQVFASDPQMRINVGIRRRLAPLMENSRATIELMTFLLLTLPGSPIIYYGDEIGMGDNFYLGDRNGVRTPMQWGPDRNAGFSRAEPQRLYLPPIMDSLYGYQSVNVEAQMRSPSSLLNWMRRFIATRKAHRAFGRGTITLLDPGNRKVFAYLREHGDETILCVVNLSRFAQAVELDLGRFEKRVPVEITDRVAFPPIQNHPYLITLAGHGHYAFRLATDVAVPAWHEQRQPKHELRVLVLTEGWKTFLQSDAAQDALRAMASRTRQQLQREVLLPYLSARRWFAGKGHTVRRIELADASEFATQEGSWLIAFLRVEYEDIPEQRYFVPLAVAWDEPGRDLMATLGAWVLARVRQHNRTGILYGAFGDPTFCRALVRGMGDNLELRLDGGSLRFTATRAYGDAAAEAAAEVHHPALEQTNTGLFFGQRLYLKAYRRLHVGINPEFEIGRFLTEVCPYPNIAPVLGMLEYVHSDGKLVSLCLLQRSVENQGDLWSYTASYLERFLLDQVLLREAQSAPPPADAHGYYTSLCSTLGRRVAELHHAFARAADDPAFDPEPASAADLSAWRESVARDVDRELEALAANRDRLPEPLRAAADRLLATGPALRARAAGAPLPQIDIVKTRYHGDLHLGQVLLAGNDFIITDFEGEPERTLDERRIKHCPLRDVAGMLRSFDYAGRVARNRLAAEHASKDEAIAAATAQWQRAATEAFLAGYRAGAAGLASVPAEADATCRLLDLFCLEKALYELRYELHNRPDWAGIPIEGLLAGMDNTPCDAAAGAGAAPDAAG